MTKHLLSTFFLLITLLTQVAQSQDFTIAQNVTGNNRTDIRGQAFIPSQQEDGAGTITSTGAVYLTSFNVIYAAGVEAQTMYIYSVLPGSTASLDDGTGGILEGESTAKAEGEFPFTNYSFEYLELDVNTTYYAVFRQDVQLEYGGSASVEGPYAGGKMLKNDGVNILENDFTALKFVGDFYESIAPKQGDLDALIALYNSTDGANWITTWDLEGDPFEWYGLIWEKGRVISIDIPQNNLQGTLPSEIGNLSELQELRLYINQLTGSIPTEIGNLTKLRRLYLYDNELTGELPAELGELEQLGDLWLRNNQLSGNLPEFLGNLTNLTDLRLQGNLFTGTIPSSLCMPNLFTLYLGENQLSGEIPAEIKNMSLIYDLRLDKNMLSGSLPAELGTLTELGDLRINGNMFTGNIPPELLGLGKLRVLMLNSNEFDGEIPDELINLTELEVLYLDNNQLEGIIPTSLASLANLQDLRLHNNKFNFSSFEQISTYLNSIEFVKLSPQEKIVLGYDTLIVKLGDQLYLTVNSDGTNNLYQWFVNDEPIEDPSASQDLMISELTRENIGTYTCKITNSIIQNLTLETTEVVVRQTIQFVSGNPYITEIGGKSIKFIVETDKDGITYFIALPVGSDAPTAEQVKAGTNALDEMAVASGSSSISAATPKEVTISGLDEQTNYDIYLVAQDIEELFSDVVKLQVETITGIENPFKNELRIYPNPVISDKLNVELNLSEKFAVYVNNLEGKQLISKEDVLGGTTLNIQNLKQGTYLLNIKTITQSGWVRFIKQ